MNHEKCYYQYTGGINMDNQLSFFETQTETWESRIQKMLDGIIKEKGLPVNSLVLKEQVNNVNAGQYIIKICEPEYPFDAKIANNVTEMPTGIRIKPETVSTRKEYLKVEINNSLFEHISRVPDSALDPQLSSASGYKQLDFKPDDPALDEFIKEAVLHKLDVYTSAAKTFGCCSRFEQCSDAKKCVHDNVLYGTACMYYWHLKRGEIFYGKNKNV